jgi:hypothetical protein
MTTEERWERIENGWLDIQQTLTASLQVETNTNEKLANLDAQLRAITAEHSNGKSQR